MSIWANIREILLADIKRKTPVQNIAQPKAESANFPKDHSRNIVTFWERYHESISSPHRKRLYTSWDFSRETVNKNGDGKSWLYGSNRSSRSASLSPDNQAQVAQPPRTPSPTLPLAKNLHPHLSSPARQTRSPPSIQLPSAQSQSRSSLQQDKPLLSRFGPFLSGQIIRHSLSPYLLVAPASHTSAQRNSPASQRNSILGPLLNDGSPALMDRSC